MEDDNKLDTDIGEIEPINFEKYRNLNGAVEDDDQPQQFN